MDAYTDECRHDCENVGLVSQHSFCWDLLTDWDDVPTHEEHNDLGPGISTYTRYDLPYDLANWMSQLSDDLYLWQLALPGSHDAGTAQCVAPASLFTRTQSFSIINQLILGVRVFDIRPTRAGQGSGREDGDIWTHHSGYKGEKLARAVICVREFLKAYPTETAIFILSHEENVE